MVEAVKVAAVVIIALVVLLILLGFIYEIFYKVKVGRAICNWFGGILLNIFSSASASLGIVSGFTKVGVEAACNTLFFW